MHIVPTPQSVHMRAPLLQSNAACLTMFTASAPVFVVQVPLGFKKPLGNPDQGQVNRETGAVGVWAAPLHA